ncbi:unnamed protein product [Candidula unifasciata]|uniref:Hexosyltransferase n=1 Tax=Candidula unifasciata TaxID=100452 RepID=A0A8S3YNJ5_9EUPU|nr:unnamed protein product [Candidula unifasciata]
MKIPVRKLCCCLLSILITFVLLLNAFVLNKLYKESSRTHEGAHVNGIRVGKNGSVKLHLAGLLLPAEGPSDDFYKLPVINEHTYGYLNKPKDACTNKRLDLLVAVVSLTINFDRRRLARQAQETVPSGKIIYLFFLGKSPYMNELQHRVDEEAKKYGDIVQEDFVDSERNLSLKSVSILRWVTDSCSDVKFVIKKDDDIRLNIDTALKSLSFKETEFKHFVMGNSKYLIEGPIRDEISKYYTSFSEYGEAFFPLFVHGPAYGFPGRTAVMLYQMSLRTKLFWLEDVYITGICAHRAKIPVFFDKGFIYTHDSVDAV